VIDENFHFELMEWPPASSAPTKKWKQGEEENIPQVRGPFSENDGPSGKYPRSGDLKLLSDALLCEREGKEKGDRI